jgi:hypothetical protein
MLKLNKVAMKHRKLCIRRLLKRSKRNLTTNKTWFLKKAKENTTSQYLLLTNSFRKKKLKPSESRSSSRC